MARSPDQHGAEEQKIKNLVRNPQLVLTISDPANPSCYFSVRGRVVNMTTDGAVDHIEKLALRYLRTPYPWYGGRDRVRLLLSTESDKVGGMG